jgi:hypothetical protein
MEMVSGDALNAMTEKAGVSMDQAKQMLPLAGDSLQEGLMSQVTGGNVDGVLEMFKSFTRGGLESNDIFGSIKNLFMKKVMMSNSFPESVAGLVATSGMKSIIGTLAGKIQADSGANNIDTGSLRNVLGGGESMIETIEGMVGGNKKEGPIDSLKHTAVKKLKKIPPQSESGSFDISIKA